MTSQVRMVLRATRLLFLCLFLAASACAQDAASALRLSVSFGTLKNTAAMSAETRAEADRFEKLAREAGAAGKYAEAMKHLYHAMAVIRGEEWTLLRALSSSLTVKLDRALLEPEQKFEVRLGEIFAPDEKPQGKLTAAISLLTVLAEETGKPVETLLKTVDSLDADWSTATTTRPCRWNVPA